jgi:gamma-glutamyltranspeptidase/glutathione hydrolase
VPAVLQLVSFLVDHGMDLEAAFHTPRIDVSGGPEIVADARLPEPVVAALRERRPVRVARVAPYPTAFACPSGLAHEPESGVMQGAAEPVVPWAGAIAARA